MATNSKVFVSPGVYTSEVDLSFVAQSVGVTTLGIAGETLKGPAFEPIFVKSYDEFQAYFGGTSPEKFVNTQIPKYEAAYIAKSYLQQSSQLFVTRILGLSGYDAGPSWSIVTKANVDPTTIGVWCLDPTVVNCEPACNEPYEITFAVDFTGCTSGIQSISFPDLNQFPDEIKNILTEQYEAFNGSLATIDDNIKSLVYSVLNSTNPNAENETISYFGSVDGADYSGLTNAGFTAQTNVFQVPAVPLDQTDLTSPFNDPWYYALFDNNGGGSYSGFSFWTIVSGLTFINPVVTSTTTLPTTPTPTPTPVNPCVTPQPFVSPTPTPTPVNVDCYSGQVVGRLYYYTGTSYTDYDDLVVATLRSRGIATYADSNNPVYEISDITKVTLNMAGEYSGVTKNPYLPFAINATNDLGTNFTFETSFSISDAQYISKVFGSSNFGKPRNVNPLFLEERFQTLLNYAWRKGYIRGLSSQIVALDSAQSNASDSIGWYLDRYQSPASPWVVSEVRGSKVFNLFKFYTISDGNSANTEVKISIADISFANQTFTVLVRDYYDTDSNPIVIDSKDQMSWLS